MKREQIELIADWRGWKKNEPITEAIKTRRTFSYAKPGKLWAMVQDFDEGDDDMQLTIHGLLDVLEGVKNANVGFALGINANGCNACVSSNCGDYDVESDNPIEATVATIYEWRKSEA